MKGADYILDRVRQNPLATAEAIALYERARGFGREHISTAALETDDSARVLVRLMGAAGLLQFVASPFKLMSLVAIREALAFEHGLLDLMFAMQGLGTYAITLAGTPELQTKYVEAAQKGEKIAAFAVTEPDAGSDLSALTTRAQRIGREYIVDGTKVFISNGPIADFCTVLARTDPAAGNKGMSMFVVERSDPGFSVARRQDVIAFHPIAELRFGKCSIPINRLVGEEGEGYKTALAVLETFRTTVAAAALGMAERALAEAIDHTQERRQFGKALADLPAVQSRLAEMATEIEGARLLVYRSAARRDGGAERIPLESGTAKIVATETAQRVIDSAVQLFGGRGVEKGSATERLYREIRALRIYEGATEILKLVVAAQLLK